MFLYVEDQKVVIFQMRFSNSVYCVSFSNTAYESEWKKEFKDYMK
jgi:hypothetical protein